MRKEVLVSSNKLKEHGIELIYDYRDRIESGKLFDSLVIRHTAIIDDVLYMSLLFDISKPDADWLNIKLKKNSRGEPYIEKEIGPFIPGVTIPGEYITESLRVYGENSGLFVYHMDNILVVQGFGRYPIGDTDSVISVDVDVFRLMDDSSSSRYTQSYDINNPLLMVNTVNMLEVDNTIPVSRFILAREYARTVNQKQTAVVPF